MDYLAKHREILEQAARGELPDRVAEGSAIPISAVRELLEEGKLSAIDASSLDGHEYLEPRITLAGREYLNELDRRAKDASVKGRAMRMGIRVLDWTGGILAGLLIAWASQFLGGE